MNPARSINVDYDFHKRFKAHCASKGVVMSKEAIRIIDRFMRLPNDESGDSLQLDDYNMIVSRFGSIKNALGYVSDQLRLKMEKQNEKE